MATQPQVTSGRPRQRVLVAALAGVLLVIVGLLVVRPLLGGGDQEQAPPAVTSASAAPTTTTPQLIAPSTSVTPAQAAGSVKDPFKPLVTTGTAGSTGGTTTGTTTGGTTTGGATAGAASATTGSTVAAAGAGAGTATTPGGGSSTERQVTLVGITGGKAKVTVDGTPYTVSEGQSFGGSYRAVDINSECATFESSASSFTLCQGEAVLK